MEDVRALLLTDVVDSTKLSEALGKRAMAEVWAAHDRVARDLCLLDRKDLAVQISAAVAASRERLTRIRSERSEVRWQRHVATLRSAMPGDLFQPTWSGATQTGINEAIQFAETAFKGLSLSH